LPKYIKVTEWHKGLSRSSNYYLVVDGNKLVHISKYATLPSQKGFDLVEYIVDLSNLIGKTVIEIMSSNSGISCDVEEYPAEDLGLNYSSRRRVRRPLSYLNNFDFSYLEPEERKFLSGDWKQYYMPMIEQLRDFFYLVKNKKLNLLDKASDVIIILPSLIDCQLKSYANYPLSFLIPYSPNARKKSLEGLTKEIHQIWVATRIVIEINNRNTLRSLTLSSSGFQFLEFKQSSSYSIVTFYCSCGNCSIWYEFDIHPLTMFDGTGWRINGPPNSLKEFYERDLKISRSKGGHSLRPDIVILCGVNSFEDFYKIEKVEVKALIECKNQDPEYWRQDVDNQIIPYKQIFQPDIAILASLKKVPEDIKIKLNKNGIKVIEDVYPGGRGEKELLDIIKTL